MSEEQNQPESNEPRRSTRRRIVYATLIFCYSLIALLMFTGEEGNSLHESALAWAFSLSMFVIGGYIFGAVVENGAFKSFFSKDN